MARSPQWYAVPTDLRQPQGGKKEAGISATPKSQNDKICELYLASPLACVAGVTGGDLKRRIEEIMRNRAAQRLNYAKKAILAVAATAAVVTPIVVGIANTPSVPAQSSPPAPSAVTPRFEVASINACKGEPAAAGRPGAEGRKGGASSSPVTFNLPCMPVRFFINLAYVIPNFQPDAVGAEAPHHKACKAQPNEGPPGLRREEIRHPRSPCGLVARHDGGCRVAVEIEAHCDPCFVAGGARGGKQRTGSGQIDA
jgi:hypothetical protein